VSARDLPARARVGGAGPLVGVVALLTLGLLAAALWTGFRQLVPSTAERLRVDAATGPGPFAVGQPVRTAIGVVTVTNVERLAGTTTKDMAGAVHGINNYVGADQTQVQVDIRVTDDTVAPIQWSPSAFRIKVGGAAPALPQSSTMPGGRLGAGTSIEGTLGFVAPRAGAALTLQLPGTDGGTVLVDLGKVDTAPPGTGSDDHGGSHP
jgi:hypothetical protein